MRTPTHATTKWFTLVELIVTATILVILTAVGFYSYSQNLVDARDSLRKSDVADLESRLKLYKQKRGAYPVPGNTFTITNSGVLVAQQWLMNNGVSLTTADTIPLDPYIKVPYFYSITTNKQQFEIALTLENADNPIAILEGDYKSVSKNTLPTITLALESTTPIEIQDGVGAGSTNRTAFIVNLGSYNLPYTFNEPYSPQNDSGIPLETILTDPTIEYWQNSDHRSCSEIYESGRSISNGTASQQYQILNSTGALENTICDFSAY